MIRAVGLLKVNHPYTTTQLMFDGKGKRQRFLEPRHDSSNQEPKFDDCKTGRKLAKTCHQQMNRTAAEQLKQPCPHRLTQAA